LSETKPSGIEIGKSSGGFPGEQLSETDWGGGESLGEQLSETKYAADKRQVSS